MGRNDIYTVFRSYDGLLHGQYQAVEGSEPGILITCTDNGDLLPDDVVRCMRFLNEDLNDNIQERIRRAQGE
jgi:hypothetical protein